MYYWVGWACRTEILFPSPLLNLHLKVFTKLHDSVSRIQNFPASDRVWGSNIPLKHLHARQKKNRGSFNDKSHKNMGHLGTFFSNSSRFGVLKNFQNFGLCRKNRGLWVTIVGKNRFLADVRSENKGTKVWQSVRTIVYMWVISHWFWILTWAWTWTDWLWLN